MNAIFVKQCQIRLYFNLLTLKGCWLIKLGELISKTAREINFSRKIHFILFICLIYTLRKIILVPIPIFCYFSLQQQNAIFLSLFVGVVCHPRLNVSRLQNPFFITKMYLPSVNICFTTYISCWLEKCSSFDIIGRLSKWLYRSLLNNTRVLAKIANLLNGRAIFLQYL